MKSEPHLLGMVPIFEYPANRARIGAFELVLNLLDALNDVTSNRLDGVAQQVQSFLKFINCEIDRETMEQVRELGAIMIKSVQGQNADVDTVRNELDRTGDYRELHIATRWSVWDVIGRLERQEEDAPTGRARFIAVPALNERDESNFDFPGIANKFTTEKYRRLRESMDEVNWRALYMNEPIEREGQLYSEEELRRYFELPKGEPDAVIGVCDTKAKGSDYCVLPVAYKYGEDYYIADAVCDNNADTGVLEEKMARILADRNVQVCQFESNSAGWSIAEQVQKRVKSFGARCSVSTKPTTANKETKIIVNAPWVKEHCLFRDKSTYTRNSDYGRLIEQMMLYTVAGKNRHDDAPDAMAMLALYAQSFGMAKVRAVERPY